MDQPGETLLAKASIRVLVVDDYEPWRRFHLSTLQKEEQLRIIGEASDGLEAVQKAQELQPDLILLDIGLPTLNGIEAARQIRSVSIASKILFVSENRSVEIAEEALSTGAGGYVLKSDAARELLSAVKAVLEGKRFVSASLAAGGLSVSPDPHIGSSISHDKRSDTHPTPHIVHHEVGFYSDDRCLVDSLTQFVGTALKRGDAAIVVATEAHREALFPSLQTYGLDIGMAIQQGRFTTLDASDAVSMFMRNDLPDPDRFIGVADNLVTKMAKSSSGHSRRVALCGECDPPLWTLGNGEAAIHLERLWNIIAARYDVDILCAYSLRSRHSMNDRLFGRICAEHSAVHAL